MTVFISGDTHGDFGPLKARAKNMSIGFGDTIIVLGDNGLNFHGAIKDNQKKNMLAKKMDCEFFIIRGNHDDRPEDIFIFPGDEINYDDYVYSGIYIPKAHYETYFGNTVIVEDKYPKIKYAIDGLVYDIEGKKALVIGGGYSVDKFYRLVNGWKWVENEMLTEEEMNSIFETFENNHVDIVLSHVAPRAFEPWVKKTFLNQGDLPGWFSIDHSMENWMNKLLWSNNNIIELWYFAHYHANFNCADIGVMLFDKIIPFGEKVKD